MPLSPVHFGLLLAEPAALTLPVRTSDIHMYRPVGTFLILMAGEITYMQPTAGLPLRLTL